MSKKQKDRKVLVRIADNRDELDRVLTLAVGNAELLTQDTLAWFLLYDEAEEVIGAAYFHPVSSVRLYVKTMFLPGQEDNSGHRFVLKTLTKFARDKLSNVAKLETTLPVEDKESLRVYQQAGYKREGVARKSIRIDGELEDQFYMGLVL